MPPKCSARPTKNQTIKELYENLNYLNKLTEQLAYLQTDHRGKWDHPSSVHNVGRTNGDVYQKRNRIGGEQPIPDDMPFGRRGILCAGHHQQQRVRQASQTVLSTNWSKKIRHLHKHGWKLPIPRYDANDQLHARLAQLGTTAEQECRTVIAESDIKSKPQGKSQSDAARKLLRNKWQPNSSNAQAIEAAVAQLLSDPAQAALAERQMAGE